MTMKKIISLILIFIFAFSLFSCSCNDNGDENGQITINRFDYDMSEYITLGEYKGLTVTVPESYIANIISSAQVKGAEKYVLRRGDSVYLSIEAYEVIESEADGETVFEVGDEITEISNERYFLENLGAGSFSQSLENLLIGGSIGNQIDDMHLYLSDSFHIAEYAGERICATIKIVDFIAVDGLICKVDFDGFYLDEDGEIKLNDEGNPDSFDSKEGSYFFIGSSLSLESFENELIGMKINEEKSFDLIMPEDYKTEILRGKSVRFVVTLKELYTPAEYTDELVSALYDFDSTEDFEEATLRKYILNQALTAVDESSTVIRYPELEYQAQHDALYAIEDDIYDKYGWSIEEYVRNSYNLSVEEYLEEALKVEMIYYAIFKNEGFTITQAHYTEKRANLIAYYQNYFRENQQLSTTDARNRAIEYINALGDVYIYEELLHEAVESLILEKTTVQ